MKGTDLKAIRVRMELTQAEMADLLFLCNRSFICDMEAGRKPISKRTAELARRIEAQPK